MTQRKFGAADSHAATMPPIDTNRRYGRALHEVFADERAPCMETPDGQRTSYPPRRAPRNEREATMHLLASCAPRLPRHRTPLLARPGRALWLVVLTGAASVAALMVLLQA